MVRLSLGVFLLQAGFHAFTAPLALVLSQQGVAVGEIGFILGAGALVQIPAALLIAPLVPVMGARRLIFAGAGSYLVASVAILLSPLPSESTAPYYAARLLQGIGIAAVLPAALSLASAAGPAHRRGLSLGFVSSAHNLTMAVFPAVALAVLAASSLAAVAVLTIVSVAFGFAVVSTLPPAPGTSATGLAPLRVRAEWVRPLATTCLVTFFWGFLQTYLPPRLSDRPGELTTFLVASGLTLVGARIASGWVADRTSPRKPTLAGILIGSAALVAVLFEPTTHASMAVAGFATGGAIGFVYTPILLELARTSAPSERGVAFALFGLALSSGLAMGSAGVAPLLESAGFDAGALTALGGLAAAALVTVVGIAKEAFGPRRPRGHP